MSLCAQNITVGLGQGSPNYDTQAKSGPRSHFIQSAETFCE